MRLTYILGQSKLAMNVKWRWMDGCITYTKTSDMWLQLIKCIFRSYILQSSTSKLIFCSKMCISSAYTVVGYDSFINHIVIACTSSSKFNIPPKKFFFCLSLLPKVSCSGNRENCLKSVPDVILFTGCL